MIEKKNNILEAHYYGTSNRLSPENNTTPVVLIHKIEYRLDGVVVKNYKGKLHKSYHYKNGKLYLIIEEKKDKIQRFKEYIRKETQNSNVSKSQNVGSI